MLSDRELIEKLKIRKRDRVMDIGGAMMQHTEIEIATLVDIIRPEEAPYTPAALQAKNFVNLDITRKSLPFKNKSFDVCLCTHTLEDLNNPFLVIEEMQRVARRGYIATPSMGKDMVFSHVNLTDWLVGPRRTPGLSHHKWFFVRERNKMIIIPKNYGLLYSGKFQIVDWSGEDEFRLFWKDNIDYTVISELNVHRLADFYEEYVKINKDKIKFGRVLKFYDNPFYYFKEYLKYILKRGEGFKQRKIIN